MSPSSWLRAFSTLPMSLRPQFLVDTEGAPSFTIYNDELYLHLDHRWPEFDLVVPFGWRR